MRRNKHTTKAQADLPCAELREDDGLAPSVWAKRYRETHRHVNYHGEQLCKQVRIAIAEAFACDCSDPCFEDLQVLEVRMASGTSVLELVLAAPDQDTVLLREILSHLQSAEGLLRSALASAINRKRLPRLRFRLVTTVR